MQLILLVVFVAVDVPLSSCMVHVQVYVLNESWCISLADLRGIFYWCLVFINVLDIIQVTHQGLPINISFRLKWFYYEIPFLYCHIP